MKKAICMALASALTCTVMSACGAKEEKQRVVINVGVGTTLSMLTYSDPDIKSGYDFLSKAAEDFEKTYTDAEVSVNVLEVNSDDENKMVVGSFDTPNALDIILKEYMDISTYIHTGRAVPLDDIITDDIRSDIGEEYWTESMYGGKTYMMPYLSMQNVLGYNKELFRQAGLEEFIADGTVTSWTLEEWDYVLDTLAKELPENVYPMMMYSYDDQGDSHIMTLLRSRGCPFFGSDGRLCVNCAEGIDALEWIKEGTAKGYFPPNPETLVILDNAQMFTNGQLAIYLMNSNLETFAREAGIDFGCVNFPSMDGKGFYTEFLTGFEVFDNSNADKLAAAKAFVKYIYESDWLYCSAGSIPVSSKVKDRYSEQLEEYSMYIENTGNCVNITANNPNWRGVRNVFHTKMRELLYGGSTAEDTAREIDEVCNQAIKEGYENSILHE